LYIVGFLTLVLRRRDGVERFRQYASRSASVARHFDVHLGNVVCAAASGFQRALCAIYQSISNVIDCLYGCREFQSFVEQDNTKIVHDAQAEYENALTRYLLVKKTKPYIVQSQDRFQCIVSCVESFVAFTLCALFQCVACGANTARTIRNAAILAHDVDRVAANGEKIRFARAIVGRTRAFFLVLSRRNRGFKSLLCFSYSLRASVSDV
jgi:hypothetical protein